MASVMNDALAWTHTVSHTNTDPGHDPCPLQVDDQILFINQTSISDKGLDKIRTLMLGESLLKFRGSTQFAQTDVLHTCHDRSSPYRNVKTIEYAPIRLCCFFTVSLGVWPTLGVDKLDMIVRRAAANNKPRAEIDAQPAPIPENTGLLAVSCGTRRGQCIAAYLFGLFGLVGLCVSHNTGTFLSRTGFLLYVHVVNCRPPTHPLLRLRTHAIPTHAPFLRFEYALIQIF